MLESLAGRVRYLVAACVGLFVAIGLVAFHYSDAQRAEDAAAFREVVEAGAPWRFVVAAVLDLGFAVAYGLLGLTLGWREQPGEGSRHRRVRHAAGVAVVLGALCDLAENVVVIANIARRDSLTDRWIDAMRTLGNLKWLLGLGGALVLLGLLVTDRTRGREQDELAEHT